MVELLKTFVEELKGAVAAISKFKKDKRLIQTGIKFFRLYGLLNNIYIDAQVIIQIVATEEWNKTDWNGIQDGRSFGALMGIILDRELNKCNECLKVMDLLHLEFQIVAPADYREIVLLVLKLQAVIHRLLDAFYEMHWSRMAWGIWCMQPLLKKLEALLIHLSELLQKNFPPGDILADIGGKHR